MRISAIAAIDSKRGLGKNNDLLFRFPEDSKRVREKTAGHPLVMGRRTYESIGRPLPNRTNIVITRDQNYSVPGIVVVHSLDEGIKVAKEVEQERLSLRGAVGDEAISKGDRHATLAMTDKEGEIFIFGGGEIFKEALPITDRLYLTIVKGDYNADTFFPDYSEFKKVLSEEHGVSGDYTYTFLDLEREK